MARVRQPWTTLSGLARGKLKVPPVLPADGVAWLAETCVERCLDEYDNVVAVTGAEGVSKSTFALHLALAIADYATAAGIEAPWTLDHLCYSARDVFDAYRTAERATVVWYDEGVRGLLAGETFDPEQVALTKGLTLVREKGAILVVCIPDIFMLAKKVRGRRAQFWVHVESRGTRRRPAPSWARVHERDERLSYDPQRQALGLQRSPSCPELCYEPFPDSDAKWQGYQAEKRRRLTEYLDETEAALTAAEAKRRRRMTVAAPAERS